ncbi:MAG: thioesterase family protein [Proteobacteria bacterium]|nr:thioesterase family protein [Pseudomonadota bacterium]
MPIPLPHKSSVMGIEPEWVDYNGHFNMAYYLVLFDRAADALLDSLGMSLDYVKTTHQSFFTLETHTSYLRELAPDHKVIVEAQILDHDHKRIHYVQQMKHAEEGWVSCVLEVMLGHVDLKAKKTSNFPPDILARIAALAEVHKALPVPPQVGHKIGLPKRA